MLTVRLLVMVIGAAAALVVAAGVVSLAVLLVAVLLGVDGWLLPSLDYRAGVRVIAWALFVLAGVWVVLGAWGLFSGDRAGDGLLCLLLALISGGVGAVLWFLDLDGDG